MGVTLISSFEAKLSETVQKIEEGFQSSGGCPFHEVINFASPCPKSSLLFPERPP